MIQTVVTDSSDVHQRADSESLSPPQQSVNAADSGISLSQLQTTAFRAIKDFEVITTTPYLHRLPENVTLYFPL